MLFGKDVRNGYCWTPRPLPFKLHQSYRPRYRGCIREFKSRVARNLVGVMQTSSWSLSWVKGRTSPWTEGPSITHIHSHTHYRLHFTCPVCIRKLTSTWREHTNSTLKGLVGLQYTGPHYTNC